MQRIERERSALVLVDYQQRLMPSIAGGEAAVAAALFVAEAARLLAVPVLGTAQNPRGLGPNVAAIEALCDRVLGKMHFDACRDGLPAALRETRAQVAQVVQVVIAGCEAHVCLMQTALGLLREGFEVFVVAPACASRRAADRELALARLAQAGAVLVSPEMVAFEWLDSCETPEFRRVLAHIKQRTA